MQGEVQTGDGDISGPAYSQPEVGPGHLGVLVNHGGTSPRCSLMEKLRCQEE